MGALDKLLSDTKSQSALDKLLGATKQTKQDLKTVEGLKTVATGAGLEQETTNVLKGKGESPKEIFSGGLIMDTFDVLNTLQYGIVGVLKGKSFIEGIKTRQSFTDKDALGDKGIPGMIAGIALDIAFDPLTYISPSSIIKGVGKATGLIKPATKITKVAKESVVGQKLGSMFIYRFGQDPIYKELAERTIRNTAIGAENAIELVKPISKLDNATQIAIANARKAGNLESLPKQLLEKAKPAFDELDRLGKEAVEVGLLKPETYQKNVGTYIARLYKKHEIPEGITEKVKTVFEKKPVRMDLSRFKMRTDIPEDVRNAMGEIVEAGYPTAKSLIQLNQAVERAKFFKTVASGWAKDTIEDGFAKLPDVKTLGELAGKAVPQPIYDDIQEIIRTKSAWEKQLGNVVAGFKFGKVILNPSTHARNIMSNFVLNNFEGLNPARLDIYGEAAKEIVKKGKWYQEAKGVGLGLDTFASREIKDMLTGPEGVSFIKKFGRKIVDTLSNLYQKEEEFAKMAQFIFQRKKGLSPEDAMKIAEKATFNYAQVTPFIRRLRESIFGYPFITFTYKATPQVVKTLVTKPGRISYIGKIKTAIENQANPEELKKERASEPSWVRNGFYVKLPIKDKYNRSAYLDLSYILPFGDLISGQFVERGIKRETGLPEGPIEAQIKKLPFPNLVRELAQNQDFYGNKIFLESDDVEKQLKDIMRHIIKTYSPPLISDQIPGGYRTSGERRPTVFQRVKAIERGGIEEGGAQTRDLQQELLRLVGLKVSPVDLELQEKYSDLEKRKAIETLLKEKGLLSEFTLPFVPSNPR